MLVVFGFQDVKDVMMSGLEDLEIRLHKKPRNTSRIFKHWTTRPDFSFTNVLD